MKILIAGKKGSGKSTLANMLSEQTGYKVFAFANALKKACALVSEIPLKNFDNPEFKDRNFLVPMRLTKNTIDAVFMLFGYKPEEYSKYTDSLANVCIRKYITSIRDFLQFVGTDVLRGFDPNIHINYLKKTIDNDAIISDIRFVNEAEAFTDEPHILIVIERDSTVNDIHSSERNIDEIKKNATFIIQNNGTLDDLKLEASNIIQKVVKNA